MARRPLISAAIVDLMARSERHAWTLEDLHSRLASDGTRTDFSSVFRAVRSLIAAGGVRKVILEDGQVCFEPVSAHHDHLQCTRCGTLVPIPCVIPRKTLTALEAQSGVKIAEHRVMFVGLCRGCRTAAERPKRRTRKSAAL